VPDLSPDPIPVRGVSVGVTVPPPGGSAGGGAGTGKPTISALNIVKTSDSTTAGLLQAAATGRQFSSATLQLTDAQSTPYLSIDFGVVSVTSVLEDSGNAAGEAVTLAVGTLDVTAGTGVVPMPSAPVETLSSSSTVLPTTSPLSSFQWGVSRPSVSGGGTGTTKPNIGDVAFVMPLDANAVALFHAAETRVTSLTITSSAGNDTYDLQDVATHTFTVTATGAAGDLPSASVSLVPGGISRTVDGTPFCSGVTDGTSC
jgi:type VI protein secretion system component Hcp